MNIAGVELLDPAPVAGGDICRSFRARTTAGRPVFVKSLSPAPAGFFAAEARGLQWLRVAGGPQLPEVIAAGEDGLVVEWVELGRPTAAAAEEFGRALARMHAAGPKRFGADRDGFIGSLPLANGSAPDWPAFYVEHRVAPYLSALSRDERRVVEQLCARIADVAGPAEPPARIHGDLWSGNVVWAADGTVWLVDAASAHGGHRESDLAMLALFGVPHLDAILGAYDEVHPLADGWRSRIPLHQLHPLLVHARLFGGSYGVRAAAAARAALAA
ncbi:MAG TPA: fructosamine kinase family protein [Mycobacteriales bacterium]|nr:fructosamine kinase family protein [Mycobacteriales bacterium]